MLLFFDLTIGRKEKRSYSKFKIEISSKKILKIGAVKLFSIYVNVFQIFDNENEVIFVTEKVFVIIGSRIQHKRPKSTTTSSI